MAHNNSKNDKAIRMYNDDELCVVDNRSSSNTRNVRSDDDDSKSDV